MMPEWVRVRCKRVGAGPHIRACTVGACWCLASSVSDERRHGFYAQNAVIEGALFCMVWGCPGLPLHVCSRATGERQEIFWMAER
jgi:hypothetical protein